MLLKGRTGHGRAQDKKEVKTIYRHQHSAFFYGHIPATRITRATSQIHDQSTSILTDSSTADCNWIIGRGGDEQQVRWQRPSE